MKKEFTTRILNSYRLQMPRIIREIMDLKVGQVVKVRIDDEKGARKRGAGNG